MSKMIRKFRWLPTLIMIVAIAFLLIGSCLRKEHIMDYTKEIKVLSQLTGKIYVERRDELLSTGAVSQASIQTYLKDADWRTSLTASILEGRLKHTDLFNKFYKELDAVNVEIEQQKALDMAGVWNVFEGKAIDDYKQDGLPIWWEMIWKLHEDWVDWKLIAAIRCIEAVPDERSLEPLVWFIECTDRDAAEAAAMALPRLPRKDKTEVYINRLIEKSDRVKDSLEGALEEIQR